LIGRKIRAFSSAGSLPSALHGKRRLYDYCLAAAVFGERVDDLLGSLFEIIHEDQTAMAGGIVRELSR
jgi:hypothetical protein